MEKVDELVRQESARDIAVTAEDLHELANRFGGISVSVSLKNAQDLFDRLITAESFIRSLARIQWEEWHGQYQDGKFWIFDGEGNGVASGKDALEAVEAMKGEEK